MPWWSSRGSRRSWGSAESPAGAWTSRRSRPSFGSMTMARPWRSCSGSGRWQRNSIEEAMIAANEVVARHMRDAKAPMIYRIHEDPDPEALDRIALVLREFDYPIKDVHGASPATFQRIVKFAHGRPEKLPDQLAPAARPRTRALRGLSRTALRPRQQGIHALHQPHSALSRPDRPPAPQGAAPRNSRDRSEHRGHGAGTRLARRALQPHGARGRDGRERLRALQALRAHGAAHRRGLSRASSPA